MFFFFKLCGGMFLTKCYVVKLGIALNVTLFVMYNHNGECTEGKTHSGSMDLAI